jgi:hypothetical protein
MLLMSIENPYLMVLLIFLVNLEEFILRVSVLKRDELLIKCFYKSTETNKDVHGCIVNIEMAISWYYLTSYDDNVSKIWLYF